MRARNALVKLLAGSLIAGLAIRYASPPGGDLLTLVAYAVRSALTQQAPQILGPEFFTTDVLLQLVFLLLIALAPLMFAIFLGRWGVATYLTGFFGGYFATLETWPLSLVFLVLSVLSVLYGEYIATS
jgi:hypothetical protein